MFLITHVVYSFRFLKLETEGKTTQTENLTEKLQTEIKTLVNPRLA